MPRVRNVGTITVTVLSDRTKELSDHIRDRAVQIVSEQANGLALRASQLAPVDTGALRTSIYVNTGTDSNYAENVGQAERLNPDMEALEEIDPEFVINLSAPVGGRAAMAVVGVAAHYGLFLEEGTVFQPPQSFLRPAAEMSGEAFQSAMSELVDDF